MNLAQAVYDTWVCVPTLNDIVLKINKYASQLNH